MVMKIDVPVEPRAIPIAPSRERWREMTKQEQEAFIVSVNEALSDPLRLMSEGRPHKKAKSRAIDMLGLHFRAMGRRIYLAEEMSVVYPDTAAFSPDVLAVLEVEEPEDDQRMAWVVENEGKGLDWVLEVVWAGDRKKDFVENVEKYALLGIPEYFVYDKKNERLLGHRLIANSNRYQPIIAQGGLYRSNVLGIDLAIVGNSLKFYEGNAELYDSAHLIKRLEGMVTSLERKKEIAEKEAETNRQTIRDMIINILAGRGVTCSASTLEALGACIDADLLKMWVNSALTAKTEAEVFGEQQ
jgi:Uma2 family endonuclease